MSLLTLVVPKEYGYVLAITASTFFVAFWHGARTSSFRKACNGKVPLPKAFADSADMSAASAEEKKSMYLFNCAQRAHANYLENHPSTVIALLIAGLQQPKLAAGMGATWVIGRIIYAIGYTDKSQEKGKGRTVGFVIQLPVALGLWGMAAWTGIKMVL